MMKLLLAPSVGKFIGCGEAKLSWIHGDHIAGPSQVGKGHTSPSWLPRVEKTRESS